MAVLRFPLPILHILLWTSLREVLFMGRGFAALAHGALALYFHAFGDGHRFESMILVAGSRCSGRIRRKDWRHPYVALSGSAFFFVSHPMVTGEAAPGDAL